MGNSEELFQGKSAPAAPAAADRAPHVFEQAREERHARHYDGKASRWIIDKVVTAAGRPRREFINVAKRDRGDEISLIEGDYVVFAFDERGKHIDVERFTVDKKGCVLHCGKNLPSAEVMGDSRRERDLTSAKGGT